MREMSNGYDQFCPVAKAAEIFAARWTPLILRELMSGMHSFNDLQRGMPLIERGCWRVLRVLRVYLSLHPAPLAPVFTKRPFRSSISLLS